MVEENETEQNFGLEEKICSLIQMYHIKREAWFGGTKLNGYMMYL